MRFLALPLIGVAITIVLWYFRKPINEAIRANYPFIGLITAVFLVLLGLGYFLGFTNFSFS